MSRSAVQAPQVGVIKVGEIRNVAIDMEGMLDTGETLTGTPTVSVSAGLSYASIAVNVGVLTINGRSVAIGKAIQFKVDATLATAGVKHVLTVSCGTTASPAQTIKREIRLDVVA